MGGVSVEHAKVMILADKSESGLDPVTYELLQMGRKLASDLQGSLAAVIIGHGIGQAVEEVSQYADEVYSIDHARLASFSPELHASLLGQLCRKIAPAVMLIGATPENMDLAPRFAYQMGVQVVTDSVQFAVEPETGHLLCTKPVYGGRIISVFKLRERPYTATLRPKAVEPIDKPLSGKGQIIQFDPEIDESLAKIEVIEKIKEEGVDLNKAEVIVAGGRGVRNAEGVDHLRDLVKALRKYFGSVELGASRPLVDTHLVPSSLQIGLTGEKVSPQLYIAVAISGSLQHLTGMLGAKKIIAINNNPDAYIFKVSDYGVVGNFENVVPALKRKLEELHEGVADNSLRKTSSIPGRSG